MSNSSLICYTRLSPNSSPRTAKIDTVTIHCMAGNGSVEGCGALFADPGTKASSNYGIGSDGRIGLYVPEDRRSWCSSNRANDDRAVTIEVANDGGAPDWHVSDRALASLVELLADICLRNGIPKLLWQGDKSLVGQVDRQNMTVHRWFANKACPGDYLYNKHAEIAERVNLRLEGLRGGPADTANAANTANTVNAANTAGAAAKDLDALADALVEQLAAKLEDRVATAALDRLLAALQGGRGGSVQEAVAEALAARAHDRLMNYILVPANAAAIVERGQEYLGRQDVPEWAQESTDYATAKFEAITDGTRPAALCTRCEAAAMALRAAEYAIVAVRMEEV